MLKRNRKQQSVGHFPRSYVVSYVYLYFPQISLCIIKKELLTPISQKHLASACALTRGINDPGVCSFWDMSPHFYLYPSPRQVHLACVWCHVRLPAATGRISYRSPCAISSPWPSQKTTKPWLILTVRPAGRPPRCVFKCMSKKTKQKNKHLLPPIFNLGISCYKTAIASTYDSTRLQGSAGVRKLDSWFEEP